MTSKYDFFYKMRLSNINAKFILQKYWDPNFFWKLYSSARITLLNTQFISLSLVTANVNIGIVTFNKTYSNSFLFYQNPIKSTEEQYCREQKSEWIIFKDIQKLYRLLEKISQTVRAWHDICVILFFLHVLQIVEKNYVNVYNDVNGVIYLKNRATQLEFFDWLHIEKRMTAMVFAIICSFKTIWMNFLKKKIQNNLNAYRFWGTNFHNLAV